jgi:hypothetical protein
MKNAPTSMYVEISSSFKTLFNYFIKGLYPFISVPIEHVHKIIGPSTKAKLLIVNMTMTGLVVPIFYTFFMPH